MSISSTDSSTARERSAHGAARRTIAWRSVTVQSSSAQAATSATNPAAARQPKPKRALAAAAFALLQVPDAPVALAALTPVPAAAVEIPAVDDRGRDVVFESRPALTRVGGRVAVDPAPKAMNVVESGALVVDGVVVDPPSARWSAAQVALDGPDSLGRLRELGIGLAVRTDGSVVDAGAPARGLPPVGVALFALWCAVPLLACVQDHTLKINRPHLHRYAD